MAGIDGVRVRRLQPHGDARGSLTELLRSDWPEFPGFGQAILTVNQPGVIRGWHSHARQTDVMVVISGRLLIVLYDGRDASPTHGRVDEHLGDWSTPMALVIPPGIFHGYKTLGSAPALILNFPDQVYDAAAPDEVRLEPPETSGIPFDWSAHT
jgi:dTDP-4-dehydrorhamnose 3,5-epimerase